VDQIQGYLLSRPLDPEALENQILKPARSTAPTKRVRAR
jgi:EAL domain-containing protein (putative c-di-GMP-specific phosphodiesterase class I)